MDDDGYDNYDDEYDQDMTLGCNLPLSKWLVFRFG